MICPQCLDEIHPHDQHQIQLGDTDAQGNRPLFCLVDMHTRVDPYELLLMDYRKLQAEVRELKRYIQEQRLRSRILDTTVYIMKGDEYVKDIDGKLIKLQGDLSVTEQNLEGRKLGITIKCP